MNRHVAYCVGLLASLLPMSAFAGQISGTIHELRTAPGIPNVTITVTDITTNQLVGTPVVSDANGGYTVSLPDNTAIRVDFQDGGVHIPADLNGIDGGTVLKGFTIFMPKQTQSCCCCRRRRCR